MVTTTSQLPPLPPPAAKITRTSELPESDYNANQYSAPIGPQQREVNANQYQQEAGPTRADYDAENRRRDAAQELKEDRRRQYEFDRATENARREKDAEKKRFDQEQEEWNFEQKQKAKTEEYEREQKEISKKTKLKEITPGSAVDRIKKGLFSKKEKPSAAPRDAPDLESTKLKYAHEERMAELKRKQTGIPKKMAKGQFKAARYKSMNYIDPFPKGGGGGRGMGFPNVDPLGGMGGSGRNMLNFGMVNFGMGSAKPQPKPQQPVRQPPQFRRKPVDINTAFGNPFAGIMSGAPAKAKPGGKTPNIMKGVTGLGLGSGKKSAKKLKRMDDWLNF